MRFKIASPQVRPRPWRFPPARAAGNTSSNPRHCFDWVANLSQITVVIVNVGGCFPVQVDVSHGVAIAIVGPLLAGARRVHLFEKQQVSVERIDGVLAVAIGQRRRSGSVTVELVVELA
jgi:hypothetical protein